MITLFLVIAIGVAAFQAIRSQTLLTAAVWLAGTSGLLSIVLYQLGAREVAVIELSVGAGLVTILFVFAISIAGDEAMQAKPMVPRLLGLALVLVVVGLLGWFSTAPEATATAVATTSFTQVLWEERGLDVLVQLVLIFAAVLNVVHLLDSSETTKRHQHHAIEQAINELDPFPEAQDLPQIPKNNRKIEEAAL